MAQVMNRMVRLKSRPEGMPSEANFEMVEGLENAPRAFIGLFHGENIGKMLVRIAPGPSSSTYLGCRAQQA